VNGTSEAFIQSITSSSTLLQTNFAFAMSSISFFASVNYFITREGTSGVVIASIISMLIRIISSYISITKFFQNPIIYLKNSLHLSNLDAKAIEMYSRRNPLFDLIPSVSLSVITALCGVLVHISARRYQHRGFSAGNALQHLSVGVVMFVAFCYSLIRHASQEEIRNALAIFKNRKRD